MASLSGIYMFVMQMYLDLLRWIFVICSSIFRMLMLAGICSGVYVIFSFTSVMRPPFLLFVVHIAYRSKAKRLLFANR